MTAVTLTVVITLVFSVLATMAVRLLALRTSVVDHPTKERKIHKNPTPLLGGVAVISAAVIGILLSWSELVGGYLLPKQLLGIIIGGLVLLIGGALDDAYDFSPKKQIVFPLIAACIVVASGIGIEYITNPFGGVIRFDSVQIQVFEWNGTPYFFTVFADLFTVLWMMGMMYTTKFLDGLDGLVSGVSVIGLVILAVLSFSATVFQPETGHLALIIAAAFLGFLLFNWNPASIFLGEGGSLFAGFALGMLAIISGGKIATALLILGIPIFDVVWVIARRIFFDKKSPFEADRKHLHLRLIDAGLSQRQAVSVLYVFTILFGAASLFLQSWSKFITLGLLIVVMILFGSIVVWQKQQRTK